MSFLVANLTPQAFRKFDSVSSYKFRKCIVCSDSSSFFFFVSLSYLHRKENTTMEVPEKGTNFEADDYCPRRPLLKSNS